MKLKILFLVIISMSLGSSIVNAQRETPHLVLKNFKKNFKKGDKHKNIGIEGVRNKIEAEESITGVFICFADTLIVECANKSDLNNSELSQRLKNNIIRIIPTEKEINSEITRKMNKLQGPEHKAEREEFVKNSTNKIVYNKMVYNIRKAEIEFSFFNREPSTGPEYNLFYKVEITKNEEHIVNYLLLRDRLLNVKGARNSLDRFISKNDKRLLEEFKNTLSDSLKLIDLEFKFTETAKNEVVKKMGKNTDGELDKALNSIVNVEYKSQCSLISAVCDVLPEEYSNQKMRIFEMVFNLSDNNADELIYYCGELEEVCKLTQEKDYKTIKNYHLYLLKQKQFEYNEK